MKSIKGLIGKRVLWDELIDRHRRTFRQHSGILQDVKGRNALVDGDWKWIPNMTNLREDQSGSGGCLKALPDAE